MTFTVDYPGAQVIPAHVNNYGHGGRATEIRAIVLHTPEERADDNEVTPRWFARPEAGVSTHYYLDNDGDVVQMVPEDRPAYAQGVRTHQRTWKGADGELPPWAADPDLNIWALSIEMEGFAASIHETMPRGGVQWRSLLAWIRYATAKYDIPIDREHIVGHDEVANHKRDPGPLFDWGGLMEDLAAEDDGTAVDSVLAALDQADEAIHLAIRLIEGS